MPRYRVPRIAVAANTKEITLELKRALGAQFHDPEKIEMIVTPHKCGASESYLFTAFDVCEGVVHFSIPDEFIDPAVGRGLYKAEIFIDECPISAIEIVKAPSIYVASANAVEHECGEDKWAEPECVDEEPHTCNKCGGCFTVADNGCPTCCNERNTLVVTYEKSNYAGDPND